MTYKVPERVYRSADGRLVRQDDPEAAFLAYVAGHELSDNAAKREGLPEFFAKKNRAQTPRDKQAAKPADKAGDRAADKDADEAADTAEDESPADDAPDAASEPEKQPEAVRTSPAARTRQKPGPKPGQRRS